LDSHWEKGDSTENAGQKVWGRVSTPWASRALHCLYTAKNQHNYTAYRCPVSESGMRTKKDMMSEMYTTDLILQIKPCL